MSFKLKTVRAIVEATTRADNPISIRAACEEKRIDPKQYRLWKSIGTSGASVAGKTGLDNTSSILYIIPFPALYISHDVASLNINTACCCCRYCAAINMDHAIPVVGGTVIVKPPIVVRVIQPMVFCGDDNDGIMVLEDDVVTLTVLILLVGTIGIGSVVVSFTIDGLDDDDDDFRFIIHTGG